MAERWIEVKRHFREKQLIETNVRLDTIESFCDWVDQSLIAHVESGAKAGMYFELKSWAGGEAFVGVCDELWSIRLFVPEHPKLTFPLCDPSRSSEDVLNIQYLGETPLSHFLDRRIAIDSIAQWMQKGYVWVCPWSLFSKASPD